MDEINEADTMVSFACKRAADIVGISYRQIDYWARTDLIRPSIAEATGSGSRRAYSYADLLELKTIKKLLDAGIKLEQVRRVFSYLRTHVSTVVASAHLVIDGDSVNVYDAGTIVDALQSGQGVLNVLALGGVRSELEGDLLRLSDRVATGDSSSASVDVSAASTG